MNAVFVDRQNGPERLVSEFEIHFGADTPLAGMKLAGGSVWRGQEGELFVTFPAQISSVPAM